MSELKPFRFNAKTHVGHKRKVNEDAILALPDHDIWVVSDGMGGHEAGDYASRLIADSIATIPVGLDPTERMYALRDAIQAAHRVILAEAEERGRGEMGRSAERSGAVHHHVGEPCPVCGDGIRAVEYRSYTVAYCPTCQTGGRVLADNTTSRFLK